MPAKLLDEEALFHAARRIGDPAARSVFIQQACGEDTPLAERVRLLVQLHEQESATGDEPPTPTATYTPITERAGARVGPYILREQIGEGGFGLVFVAEQQEPVKRKVALKIIKPGMDSARVIARFEAERQALALMDHPNIARVLDADATDSGRPYFVMELIRGIPITDYCDQNQLTPNDRLELFVSVCHAIQHAHQKGVIHRDIKPSNVLVTSHDGKPVAKVIDFGVAKAISQHLTEKTIYTNFAQMIGTPLYMSPEQAEMSGLDIDTRSDIYSLGVLLYELLTGSTPLERKRFATAAFDEIRRLIREEEPPRPSHRLSTSDALPSLAASRKTEPAKLSRMLRGELDWVVMKALEKDRTRRYETANGLARDIQRYLANEVVEARPPSTSYRLRKFVGRNRAQVVAASLVLAALVAGIAGTTIGLIEARRQEAEARRQEGLARDEATAREQARAAEAKQRQAAEKAAAAEKEAKEQTQKRLAQIEKGVELFAGLLAGINPKAEEKQSKPLYEQLRERAEKAADQLQAEAVADPLAEARLQTILGITLLELGGYSKAIAVLERARATRVRELGIDHPDTLTTLNDLAGAYELAGRRPEATPLLEQVRDARVRMLGAEHPDTLTSLHNLAGAYRDTRRMTEAITLFEQVRDARVKKLGMDHPDTLSVLNNLAGAYHDVERIAEAITLFEQVRDRRVRELGVDHPSTLITLHNLAEAYRDAGRPAEAVGLYAQVYEASAKKLGADHPDTLVTLNNLAATYWSLNRLDKSIPLFKDVLVRREKQLGRQHPSTLTTVANLGVNYKDAGRLPEAIPLLEEAYRAAKKYPTLGWVGPPLLDGYLKTGRTLEGIRLIDDLLADARKQFPKDSPQLAGLLAQAGLALLESKAFTEAEPMLRECLAIREATQPDAWNTFNTQSALGGALLGKMKYADAEPLLLKGYEGMKAREKAIPQHRGGELRIPEAIDRLIKLYTATNKPDEVKKWRAERAKYPPPRAPMPREVN